MILREPFLRYPSTQCSTGHSQNNDIAVVGSCTFGCGCQANTTFGKTSARMHIIMQSFCWLPLLLCAVIIPGQATRAIMCLPVIGLAILRQSYQTHKLFSNISDVKLGLVWAIRKRFPQQTNCPEQTNLSFWRSTAASCMASISSSGKRTVYCPFCHLGDVLPLQECGKRHDYVASLYTHRERDDSKRLKQLRLSGIVRTLTVCSD